jgi:hypothetical protein
MKQTTRSRFDCSKETCASQPKKNALKARKNHHHAYAKASSLHLTYAIQAQRNNAHSQVLQVVESREGSSLHARDLIVAKMPARHSHTDTHKERKANHHAYTPCRESHIRNTGTAQQRTLTGHAGCRVPPTLQPPRSRFG